MMLTPDFPPSMPPCPPPTLELLVTQGAPFALNIQFLVFNFLLVTFLNI